MNEQLNQQWRAFARRNKSKLLAAAATVDVTDGSDWAWCVEALLDVWDMPHIITDHGLCADDDRPKVHEEAVLIACPLTPETTEQDLLEFDAALESAWECAWQIDGGVPQFQ